MPLHIKNPSSIGILMGARPTVVKLPSLVFLGVDPRLQVTYENKCATCENAAIFPELRYINLKKEQLNGDKVH